MARGTILIADDDTAIRTVLNQALARAGYAPRATGNATTLWRWVSQGEGDVVLTDVVMPDENAFDLIPRIKKIRPDLPIIVMSAQNTLMTALTAAEKGAYEYLPKPFDLNEVVSIVGRALTQPGQRLQRPAQEIENEELPLIGRSPAMQEIYRVLARLTQTDLTVMINGESGTGKELVARVLHDYGRRRQGPFVAINMAAIPRELVESELFGHEKGAFTGAGQRHAGYVERARDGVLFLDEVGELPLAVQAKLLRLIQDRSYMRVGGEDALHCKARFVFATNADLAKAVEAGRFRRDLFYRINVIDVAIPPLRDRREDILPLARLFLDEFADAFARPLRGIDPRTEAMLLNHGWPGNVRELRNRIERAVALAEGPQLATADLFPGEAAAPANPPTLAEVREAAERRHIREVLASTRGDAVRAAAILGISRSTFFEKIRRLGIDHHPS